MKKTVLSLLLAPALALASYAGSAGAADYPQKPIRMVVPFAPGGITDVMGRTIANKLTAELGQPVIVENKPGASGMIGCEMVAKSAPDGYTLLMAGIAPLGTNPVMYKAIKYDPVKSFEHISMIAKQPLIVAINPKIPANNIQELVAYLKKRPAGDMFYGTSGSSYQLITEAFTSALGVKMTHVPFKGSTPAIEALIGGQIGFMIDPFSTLNGQVKGGRVKGLALTSDKRLEIANELPTVSETAIAGFEASSWQGVLAPAGTPADIVKKLNEAIVKILKTNEIKQQFAAAGVQPSPSTPAEFRKHIVDENARWRKVADTAGIVAE
ncbi:Bug family tripartite tricarboxylate transporter substrate binding protein [Lacisediminimonas profundi]|uniref:Bug family tripartite tricarboxylate transporter substrate binding protein n=1 Tax=Lacisediminimonas profundi TaxID=2603856 RepID=UPI00124B631A|nr:tripartite tricarboxylate transporter substrate binding protein [Lacisediminimonas profundi]